MIIQMHNYKGQLRREVQDNTPTKSSWDKEKEYQPQKYEPRYDNKMETKQDEKYEQRNQGRFDPKYDKSQISYYQSQGSRVIYDYDRSEKPSMKSQTYFQDEKYVFNEIMSVRIKSFESEEREQRLRLQIQNKSQKGVSILIIYLTNDKDPKFLWNFTIRQGDFMNLKNEQKLKVGYSNFPEMLRDCFKECVQEGELHGQGRNNHLLLEIRKGGQGTLFVLQSNRYKESVHLFLHFKFANDELIKEHLSNKLLFAQEEINKNKQAISKLENTLQQRMHEVHNLNAELNKTIKERERITEQFKVEEGRKFNSLESKNNQERDKKKKEYQLEVKEVKKELGGQLQTLNRDKNNLSNALTEARQKIANLESDNKEQRIKIVRLEQDVTKYLSQYEKFKTDNKDLSDKRYHNEISIAELTCKIQSLRSELEDKKTIISSTVQLKETNSNQIFTLEQQNTENKKQIVKLETKITELEGEIARLNTVNGDILQKVSRQKEKLQERAEVIKQQQKQVKQLKRIESTLNRENEDLNFRNADKQTKIRSLQEQLEIVQKKLQDQTNMVVYLQKCLNERPTLRTAPFYSNAYQPTPPYSGLNRELPSQVSVNSNVSTSRAGLSGSNSNNSKGERYEPNIKRYEQRSKSPIQKRLTQQREPEEQQNLTYKAPSFDQPRPVKFKMSAPGQSEK